MQAGGVPVTGDTAYVDPRWQWPEYADGAVVEVRIHGIGGEGPQGMTRDPHPVRVGGDDGVGFWRARNPTVPTPEPLPEHADQRLADASTPDAPASHAREVVSWGGSTSGRRRSAFWVLLLPFALFNAAGRMSPAASSAWRTTLHEAVCRLLALTMTLSVVALTTGVVVDLVALQCGAQPLCAEADLVGRWLLAPLRWLRGDAAALVSLLALLPVVAVYLLRIAGRRDLTHIGYPSPPVTHGTRPARLIQQSDFWANRWPAWRLRGVHITAGYAWTVVVLAAVLPRLLPDLPSWVEPVAAGVGWGSLVGNAVVVALPRTIGTAPSHHLGRAILALRGATLLALGGLVGTGLAGATDLLDRAAAPGAVVTLGALGVLWSYRELVRHMGREPATGAGPSGAARDAAMFGGVAALAAVVGMAGAERVSSAAAAGTLGAGGWFGPVLDGAPAAVYAPLWALVCSQVVLVAVLVATSAGRTDRSDDHSPPATPGPRPSPGFRAGRGPMPTAAVPGNLAAPVIALLSLLLVSAVGSGIHGAVLDWLGRRTAGYDPPTDPLEPLLGTDPVAPREAVQLALPWWHSWTALVVVMAVLAIAVAAWLLRWWIRRNPPGPDQVATAVARSLAPPVPDDPDADVAAAMQAARDRTAVRWLDQALVQRSGEALLYAVVPVAGAVVAIAAASLMRGAVPAEPPLASTWLWLLGLLPLAVVLVIRSAREDRLVRRRLASLWDILAFWPRLTHPFSPPSYGEALVPAVSARVEALVERGHPVLLAGHSQGSVVALATALHLAPRERALHLVTYGSPLRLLYEGFFPTVFGGDNGAIAHGTPDPDGQHRAPRSWHNVLALSEPLGTPIWRHSLTDDLDTTDRDVHAWDVHLQLPWAECVVCGWSRESSRSITALTHTALDITITDPDRLVSPTGAADGRPLGHSSYHRSRELDLHLAHLAAAIHTEQAEA